MRVLGLAAIMVSLVAVLAALPFLPGWMTSSKSYGLMVNKSAPSFELLNTDNQLKSLADYRGQFIYLYFGYLNCNGVCQSHLATFFHLSNHVKTQPFKILFITLDSARDTQQVLKQRIESIHPKFEALWTEQMSEMQALALKYQVPFYREPGKSLTAQDYEMNHAGFVFLIDPDGQWRRTYTGRFLDYTKMQQDLESLAMTDPQI